MSQHNRRRGPLHYLDYVGSAQPTAMHPYKQFVFQNGWNRSVFYANVVKRVVDYSVHSAFSLALFVCCPGLTAISIARTGVTRTVQGEAYPRPDHEWPFWTIWVAIERKRGNLERMYKCRRYWPVTAFSI